MDRINRIDRICGRLAGATIGAIALVMCLAALLAAALAAAVVEPRLERLDAKVLGDGAAAASRDLKKQIVVFPARDLPDHSLTVRVSPFIVMSFPAILLALLECEQFVMSLLDALSDIPVANFFSRAADDKGDKKPPG